MTIDLIQRLNLIKREVGFWGSVAPVRLWPYPNEVDRIIEFHRQNDDRAYLNADAIILVHQTTKRSMQPSLGLFRGNLEPSYVLEMTGWPINLIGVLAEWGQRHEQNSIAAAFPPMGTNKDDTGPGVRYILPLFRPLTPNEVNAFYERLSQIGNYDALLCINEQGQMVGVEYWSEQPDRLALADVRYILQQIVQGESIGWTIPLTGYLVHFADYRSFPGWIEASVPGRSVERGCDVDGYVY